MDGKKILAAPLIDSVTILENIGDGSKGLTRVRWFLYSKIGQLHKLENQ
jgi:hypothetical protein